MTAHAMGQPLLTHFIRILHLVLTKDDRGSVDSLREAGDAHGVATFISHTGHSLPHRRFYTPVTDYQRSVPEGEDGRAEFNPECDRYSGDDAWSSCQEW